jgi:shikimate dehydrogenase
MAAVRALNLSGLSITIPHKVSVLTFLDEIDPLARQIGAVNTVINREGRLMGYNSDGLGAVQALSDHCEISGKTIAVIGAGGAARAVAFAIKARGGQVIIVNRSSSKGEALAKDIDTDFRPLSEIGTCVFDILINTTPVGMKPDTESMPVPTEILDSRPVVMDIVYSPLQTRLLKTAKKRGCLTIDGLAMFVNQGAFQFGLWTQQKAPMALMRKVVSDALEGKL